MPGLIGGFENVNPDMPNMGKSVQGSHALDEDVKCSSTVNLPHRQLDKSSLDVLSKASGYACQKPSVVGSVGACCF